MVHGIQNLESIEGLFEDLKKGTHFGKLVVKTDPDGKEDQSTARL